jgi:hypothetical protein
MIGRPCLNQDPMTKVDAHPAVTRYPRTVGIDRRRQAECGNVVCSDKGVYLNNLSVVDAKDVDHESFVCRAARPAEIVHERRPTFGRGPDGAPVDLTVYNRQEEWEDSPAGWPQDETQSWFRRDGRPIPQWTRPGVVAKT